MDNEPDHALKVNEGWHIDLKYVENSVKLGYDTCQVFSCIHNATSVVRVWSEGRLLATTACLTHKTMLRSLVFYPVITDSPEGS